MNDRAIIQRSQEKVEKARRELEEMREEPIHRYSFKIPQAVPAPVSISSEEVSADLTQIVEQLRRQSQLLMDLLGAVNSLIATQLCRRL